MIRKEKRLVLIDRSIRSVDNYLSEISPYKPLTTDDEYNLWILMQNGDDNARELLICANLRYVVKAAKKYLGSKAPLEDLIQAGNEGLVKAAMTFDASLGYRFISYATWFVENEVRRAVNDYILHKGKSLDTPVNPDKEDGPQVIDFIYAHPCQSTDWNLRYRDTLVELKRRAEERQFGFGALTAELYQMLTDGYTTSDFARKHHLNEKQMTRLFTVLREESTTLRRAA